MVLTSIPCLAPFSLPATPRGQPHPNRGVLLGRGSNQQHSKVYALPNVWTFFSVLHLFYILSVQLLASDQSDLRHLHTVGGIFLHALKGVLLSEFSV